LIVALSNASASSVCPGSSHEQDGRTAHGIDMEPSHVEIARSIAKRVGLTNAKFYARTTYELPFADEAFFMIQLLT
ncbi:MAG: hypothetical protein J4O08_06930, partial [Chloroflexi bacterium]|nr:hypothetical protein [Chloroflexota bacterium]